MRWPTRSCCPELRELLAGDLRGGSERPADVATPVNGVRELIDDGRNGFLMAPAAGA